MRRAWKFRLYPNQEQADTLNKNLMLCRHLYNTGLEQRITAYERGYIVSFTIRNAQEPLSRKVN